MKPACALCQRPSDLRESHIVPKFVGRWLKETSATGYLRGAVEPNVRLQDIGTRKLLCDSCEGQFAEWEKIFKKAFFDVVQSDEPFGVIEYDAWLLKFLVSISWRIIAVDGEKLVLEHPQHEAVLRAAELSFREFLLAKRSNTDGFEHHIFVFAGIPAEMGSYWHPKMLHYMLRGIDSTFGVSSRQLFAYSNLVRSILFSPLTPRSPSGWKRTRVFAGPGRLTSPQTLSMPGFGDFVNSRVEEGFAKPLSQRQLEAIKKTILKDPEKALQSESHRVHMATKRFRQQDPEGGDSR